MKNLVSLSIKLTNKKQFNQLINQKLLWTKNNKIFIMQFKNICRVNLLINKIILKI